MYCGKTWGITPYLLRLAVCVLNVLVIKFAEESGCMQAQGQHAGDRAEAIGENQKERDDQLRR